MTVKIVNAITDAQNEDPRSLEPLATYIDPEAIEKLVESSTVETTISLELYGCSLEIDGKGNLAVNQVDRPTDQ